MKFSTKVPILSSNSFMKKKIIEHLLYMRHHSRSFTYIHGVRRGTDKKALLSWYLHLGTNLRTTM